MRKIFVIVIVLHQHLMAQEISTGIKFDNSLTWNEILSTAKATNKYIFLDCFATWCGPCKQMDRNVYTSDKLGEIAGNSFISVKVQMDSTLHDPLHVKRWYADADFIRREYKIEAYPSFLFFSPDGNLILKDVGYKNVDDFKALLRMVTNPSSRYNVLVDNYKKGIKDYTKMISLILMARNMGDTSLAMTMVDDYKENYLDKLDVNELCTKENLELLQEFPHLIFYSDGSKSKFFRLFYQFPKIVNEKMNWGGFAEFYVAEVIKKEEVYDKIYEFGDRRNKTITTTPNWRRLSFNIAKKYNPSFADRVIFPTKIEFYKITDNWIKYADVFEKQLKAHPPKRGTGIGSDPWNINSEAWDVFLKCNVKNVLKKALKWSDISIHLEEDSAVSVQYYDTKANILYKLGRVEEGIMWEEKAIALDSALASRRGEYKGPFYDEYNATLIKMRTGKPTW